MKSKNRFPAQGITVSLSLFSWINYSVQMSNFNFFKILRANLFVHPINCKL